MLLQWLKRLFCIEWHTPRCVSTLNGKAIVLSRSFVRGATGLIIEWEARWPLLSWAWPPVLTCSLQNEVGQALPHAAVFHIGETGRKVRLRVEVPVEGLATSTAIVLRVFENNGKAILVSTTFTGLDAGQVVQALQPKKFTVTARHDQRHSTGTRLHDQVERLEYELSLSVPDSEHRALLEQRGDLLRLQLADADGRDVLRSEVAFRFAGENFRWNGVLPVAAVWHRKPGPYALSLATGQTTLAALNYEVVDFTERGIQVCHEVERMTQIRHLEFTCQNHLDHSAPLAVVAEDYLSLAAAVVLDVPLVDELFPPGQHHLRLTVASVDSIAQALDQVCELTLSPGTNEMNVRLQIGPGTFRAGPGHYRVRLFLGERLLGEQDFAHRLRREIQREKAAAIFQSLEMSGLKLFSRRDGQRVETGEVWETDAEIIPAFSVVGRGFDDDAPKVRWRLRVQVREAGGGVVRELDRYLHAGAGRNEHSKVAIPVQSDSGQRLAPGHYELVLLKRDTIMMAVPFRILATEEVVARLRRDILASVRIADLRVRVHAGAQCYESDQVADTSDYLGVQFKVSATGFHQLLPELAVTLTLVLEHGQSEQPLLEQTVCLRSGQMPVRNLLVRVREGVLAMSPGPCRLTILLGGKSQAAHAFTIVSAESILERVKISRLDFQSKPMTNGRSRSSSTLVYQPDLLIAPAFVLVSEVLAPNLLVPVEVVVQSGAGVLARAQMDISLQSHEETITSQPMRLRSLGSERLLTQSPLTLAVCVGGTRKAALVVRLMESDRIVNYEGQLATDASQMNVDEDACRETLARLRI